MEVSANSGSASDSLDQRPEGGGKYFHAHDFTDQDNTPGCFVCGGPDGRRNYITASVSCKAAGERVVAMFKQGAWLDDSSPDATEVKVKVAACDGHRVKLIVLQGMARHGVLTQADVDAVLV